MKKTFRKIHLWLSVPFGIVLTLICFSGAMLVFESEITRLLHPERYTVSITGPRLPLATLVHNVAQTLPDSVQTTGIKLYPDPTATAEVGLTQPRHAVMFVNPYTGEVIGRNQRPAFFKTMFALHRWLLSDYKRGEFSWGKTIVGVSALMFIFVLISGLFIWWPRTRRALRNNLKVVSGKGRHRFFYTLHSAGGFYAFLLLLVMAVTGPTWSFEWYRQGFYTLLGAQLPQEKGHGGQGKGGFNGKGKPEGKGKPDGKGKPEGKGHPHDKGKPFPSSTPSPEAPEAQPLQVPASVAVWDKVYATLSAKNPDCRDIEVGDGTAFVDLNGWGNQRAFDAYEFDPATGRITAPHLYADAERMQKAGGWVLSLHKGDWGGWLSKVLYFLAALFGATLPLTGYYLWAKRTFLRKKKA